MKRISKLVIHHSATRPSQDIGDAEIKEMHLAKGWVDIGYHVVIRRNGVIEFGRPFDIQGAHVYGHNDGTLGICLIGGISQDGKKAENNFTKEQIVVLSHVMRGLLCIFPNAVILGHRELAGTRTACPAINVMGFCMQHNFPYGG